MMSLIFFPLALVQIYLIYKVSKDRTNVGPDVNRETEGRADERETSPDDREPSDLSNATFEDNVKT